MIVTVELGISKSALSLSISPTTTQVPQSGGGKVAIKERGNGGVGRRVPMAKLTNNNNIIMCDNVELMT